MVRAQDLQQELTAGGLWKEIRDEYLTWENNHTQRGDAAPFACQEFPWQRTLSFRMLSKVCVSISLFTFTTSLLVLLLACLIWIYSYK